MESSSAPAAAGPVRQINSERTVSSPPPRLVERRSDRIVYRLPGPVEGLSGPRQYPFASATGTLFRKYSCIFHCPSINLTSTMIPRDARSSDHQYQPGSLGGPGSSAREGAAVAC